MAVSTFIENGSSEAAAAGTLAGITDEWLKMGTTGGG
jgi:hypothetical protein